jgi:glycosyltransferase involved in cell wall biosynthesis
VRIGVNARSLAAPQIRGWTRYAVQLLKHLPAFGAELVLLTDQPLNQEYLAQLEPGSFRIRQAPPMRYLAWEQAWLPLACTRERVTLLHAPANYGLPVLGTCPGVLTLHDAIDVAFEPSSARLAIRDRLVRASFWAARRAASQIITVSEHAKSDLLRHFSLAPSKVTSIHEASDLHERAPSADREQRLFDELNISRPFVLYAGGFERRKNVVFLLDAFGDAALGDVALVLVGGSATTEVCNRVTALQRRHMDIRLTGFVPDATLAALYRRALVFVYPSRYEGFGLQLCESMSFGCPTLAADNTSLPEVLGDGGETFPTTNPGILVALLRRLSAEPSYRRELSARALERSHAFSWQRTAKLTYEVFQKCLAERQR